MSCRSSLNTDEAKFLDCLLNENEINKLCHPLYGALLYSPLYLLVQRKLTGNAWSQEQMVLVRPNFFLT